MKSSEVCGFPVKGDTREDLDNFSVIFSSVQLRGQGTNMKVYSC